MHEEVEPGDWRVYANTSDENLRTADRDVPVECQAEVNEEIRRLFQELQKESQEKQPGGEFQEEGVRSSRTAVPGRVCQDFYEFQESAQPSN